MTAMAHDLALLRGINVGAQKLIKMSELEACLEPDLPVGDHPHWNATTQLVRVLDARAG